ncbi:MAG: hypothetical protein V3W18_06480 [candidate division Zixibacteria bacterium]
MKIAIIILVTLIVITGCQQLTFNLELRDDGDWSEKLFIVENKIAMELKGRFNPAQGQDIYCLDFKFYPLDKELPEKLGQLLNVKVSGLDITSSYMISDDDRYCDASLTVRINRADLSSFALKGYLRYLESAIIEITITDLFGEPKTIEARMNPDVIVAYLDSSGKEYSKNNSEVALDL